VRLAKEERFRVICTDFVTTPDDYLYSLPPRLPPIIISSNYLKGAKYNTERIKE
jgi:hypothetical protein